MLRASLRLWQVFALFHIVFFALWCMAAVRDGLPLNDWWAFRLAAERVWDGQFDMIYPLDFEARKDHFIYPPYALWMYLPTVWMSETVAFLVIATGQLTSLVTATVLLIREIRPDENTRDTLIATLFGSASATWLVVLGQNGGLFLLAYTLAYIALNRGYPVLAGVGLGILGLKPNWTVAPTALLAFRGRRMLLGFAGVGIALVLISLPLGVQRWFDFVTVSSHQASMVSATLDGRHNITIRGLVLALSDSELVVNIVWAVLLVPAIAALVRLWRPETDPLRKVSSLVLFTLSMNLYTNVYDGVVMVLPALDWVCGRNLLPDPLRRAGVVAMMIAWTWDARTWMWPIVLPDVLEPGPFSLVGLVALGMLLVLAHQAAPRSA